MNKFEDFQFIVSRVFACCFPWFTWARDIDLTSTYRVLRKSLHPWSELRITACTVPIRWLMFNVCNISLIHAVTMEAYDPIHWRDLDLVRLPFASMPPLISHNSRRCRVDFQFACLFLSYLYNFRNGLRRIVRVHICILLICSRTKWFLINILSDTCCFTGVTVIL